MKFTEYKLRLTINAHVISLIRIGQHYKIKHGTYMNDELILELLLSLDGGTYQVDSSTNGISYYAADVVHESPNGLKRVYRIIWLLEGDVFEILGVINAYRRKTRKRNKE